MTKLPGGISTISGKIDAVWDHATRGWRCWRGGRRRDDDMVHSGRHRLGGQRYDVEQRRVDRIGEPVKTSPHVLTVQGLKTQLPEIRDLPRIHQVQHRGIVAFLLATM